MLDYQQLAALDAVVSEGGFEKAGKVLHISQSAVTQRIRQLEELCGQILLVRNQPPVLTDRGRQLLEHFKKVRLLETELGMEVASEEPPEKPVIHLAVNADSLATWFPDVLEEYMEKGSGFVHVRTADQDITRQLLKMGEVMGCISTSSTPVRGCKVTYLGRMTYFTVCTEGYYNRYFPHGLNREDFRNAPKLNFNRDDSLLSGWADRLFQDADGFHDSHFVPSSDLFPLLISGGRVCGMITEDQFHEISSKANLINLTGDHPVEVSLYWQRWALESKEMDLLGEIIRRVSFKALLQ